MNHGLLACGPFFDPTGLIISLVVLLIFKPLAYFAFIQAFRYRVSRPVPMTVRQAVKLAGIRTLLGVVLVGGGALFFSNYSSREFWNYSWIYLYGQRVLVWAALGWYGAALRGRRWVGWTLSGTGLDAAFDAGLVFGAFAGLIAPLVVLVAVGVFIGLLHEIGQREALKNRFTKDPLCATCHYNLTGNLSGICPECGTPVAASVQAALKAGPVADAGM